MTGRWAFSLRFDAVQSLRERGVELPCQLEVVGFSDEEGVRIRRLISAAARSPNFDRRRTGRD